MKKILTGFIVTFVAAVWMTGSWLFFNSIAVGAQGAVASSVADADKADSKDTCPAGKHCGKHWKGRHHGLWKKLNLTEAQRSQIKTIMSEERPKMKPLFQQLKAGRDQINSLGQSGQFDEAKVRSIAKGQADTLIELIVARERVKSRVYALLTPEQRTKAQELRESWKARHHGKGHMEED